jgi:hypothetical protein
MSPDARFSMNKIKFFVFVLAVFGASVCFVSRAIAAAASQTFTSQGDWETGSGDGFISTTQSPGATPNYMSTCSCRESGMSFDFVTTP